MRQSAFRATTQDDNSYDRTPWNDYSPVYHDFSVSDYQPVDELRYQLYPHQISGLEWLRYREVDPPGGFDHRGGILSDDMGLGKTIQIMALLVLDKIHPERLNFQYTFKNKYHSFINSHNQLIHELYQKLQGHAYNLFVIYTIPFFLLFSFLLFFPFF